MTQEFTGCLIDHEVTAEVVARMESDGMIVGYGASKPSLVGWYKRQVSRGVIKSLAQDSEFKVNGKMRKAYRQSGPVCVSRGTGGAIEDSYLFSLAGRSVVGVPVEIATEPIYGGARIAIGKGRLGNKGGAYGCNAAEYVSRYGVVSRGKYGSIDLTESNDDLAGQWGAPQAGVPKLIQDASLSHEVSAHKVDSTEELADAIWAGYFGAVCRSMYSSAVDGDGFGIFNNQGGHCTEVSGAYINSRGRLCFVEQQSHGSGRPTMNPIAKTDSCDIPLRDGSYPVRMEDMATAIQTGECWVFSVKTGSEFRN